MNILNLLTQWAPALVTVAIFSFFIWLVYFFLRNGGKGRVNAPLVRQLSTFFIVAIGIVVLIITMPIGDSTKGQLLSLLGILGTGAIALSSTTFIGNAMGGLMLKSLNKVKLGDFLQIEEHFGRVTEIGLLHTEIQGEDRDLTTMPNLLLVTKPVKVVRSSGTVISATVSLGYDVAQGKVEKVLKEAALKADLKEPFVYIMELGDYSVTYRISGFLKEVKYLLSARSRLRECMLDYLHENKIEIVSPTFMNQRVFPIEKQFIPKFNPIYEQEEEKPPEEMIFDKAEEAESIGKLQERCEGIREDIKETKELLDDSKSKEDKEKYEAILERLKTREENLLNLIEKKKEEAELENS